MVASPYMKRESVTAAIALCAVTLSCTPASGPEQPSQPPARFVAFRAPKMFLDRLERPTEPPYAAGSARGGDMLVSSDPTVVGVDPAGNLIAHRNGKASIRAADGAALEVTVQSARSLKITPSRFEIEPGARREVEVTIDDGQRVAPEARRWQTSNPNIAAANGSTVQAGTIQGAVSLTAGLGDASAGVVVVVRARPQRNQASARPRN